MKEDQDLLVRARRGEREAWAEIYDRYSGGLFAYAYRLLGDSLQAEDCVSETFQRCLAAVQGGRGPEDYIQAYLYRIAHNWITDVYRRQPPPPMMLDDELEQAANDTEGEALENLTRAQVRAAMRRLTDDQRQVVNLKFYAGWENAEIAAALGKPVGAVKSLQVRALEALRRMLTPADAEDEERIYATAQ